MTMDVSNRKLEMKSEIIIRDEQTQITPNKMVKRPFDVAFLMLPDEKMKQKQANNKLHKADVNCQQTIDEECYNNNNDKLEDDEEIEVGNFHDIHRSDLRIHNHQKYFTQKQQIFDDPNLIKARNLDELRGKSSGLNVSSPEQKSAFTKVNLVSKDRTSPSLSISPDLSYQNSLSPSPPIMNRSYHNFPANILTQGQIFKNQQVSPYQNNLLPENFNPAIAANLENPFLLKTNPTPELLQPNFNKLRPIYRPDLHYSYQQFSGHEVLKMSPPDLKFAPDIRHPATAILTSLLPPSLAALSLPAQNVCAKCNISFRMTSDLVYHMRSHHKNDSTDFSRRRREDKLKCPVCAESFRERHHLTRHMTAHQDKEEEIKESRNLVKKSFD